MFINRKKLISAIVLGGLIGSTALAMPGTAKAEVPRLIQPNSSWAVSKIDATQGTGEYCALARRFSNDIVLTFARNAHDESSVAIDFQKQTMSSDHDYRVTISPGYGQVRSFEIRPVSGKALVARLGQDYAFYDALNRSGRLDVDIAGDSYNFNLPDLNEGQDKLNTCLGSLAGAEKNVAMPGTVTGQNAPGPTPSGDLTGAAAQNAPQPMLSAPAPAPQPSAQSGADVGQSASASDLESLRMENMRLRKALEQERTRYENNYMKQSADSPAAAELNEKVRLLEIENKELRKQASASGGKVDDAGTLSAENAKLQDRIKELQAENARLASLPAAAGAGAAAATGDVEQSLAAMNARKSMEAELETVRKERDRYKAELDSMHKTAADGRVASIAGDNWDLEQATRRYNEAERELQRLGNQMQEERANCSQEKSTLETKLFDPAIAEKEQIAKLVKLQSDLDTANASLKIQKDTYEDEIAHLKSKLDEASTQANAAGQQQSAEVQQLQQQLAQTQSAMQMQKDTSDSYIAELESKIAALRNQMPSDQMAAYNSNNMTPAPGADNNAMAQQPAPLDPGGYAQSYTPPQDYQQQPMANNGQAAYPGDYMGDLDDMPNQMAPAQQQAYQPPQQQQPVYQPPAQQQAYQQPMTPPPLANPSANFMSPQQVGNFLQSAGITLKGLVQPVKSVNDEGYTAYSWDTGAMFGSIEQHSMTSLNQFDVLAGQYLRKTESRCKGEFAAVPSVSQMRGTIRVESYEIACVGQDDSASASILFFNRNGVFTTIAHETGVDGMSDAMDARDSMISVVINNAMASQ